jgi:hypothetical protein
MLPRPESAYQGFLSVTPLHHNDKNLNFKNLRLISFLGLVCTALFFFSTCQSSNSGPSGPVSKTYT